MNRKNSSRKYRTVWTGWSCLVTGKSFVVAEVYPCERLGKVNLGIWSKMMINVFMPKEFQIHIVGKDWMI